jgi:glutathione S-transferase
VAKPVQILDDLGQGLHGPKAMRARLGKEKGTDMLTFFHSPGSCSDGIAFLLREVGAEFETVIVNVREGAQHAPTYRARNPKGKVPAIACADGTVLTEFGAIAWWLAQRYPQAGLWPDDLTARFRILEALDFMIGSVHMRGFTFVKVPQKFIADPAAQLALRNHGRTEAQKGLTILSEMIGGGDYLLGDFSVADGALFYLLTWAEAERIDIPANLATCHARLRARPAGACGGLKAG